MHTNSICVKKGKLKRQNPELLGSKDNMSHPVVIVDYDPRWPVLFEEERCRVLGAIGYKVLALEHIGSTAVPGLGAKPIIDMMAGVRSSKDADECVRLLQPLGYDDVTPQPGNPEWFYCVGTRAPDQREDEYIHLDRSMVSDLSRRMLKKGYIVHTCGRPRTVIRFMPPITITEEMLDGAVTALGEAVREAEKK
jgi:hypothetical protein